jgi:nitroreductase
MAGPGEATPAIKLAHNDHPILDLLRRRWSGRAIDPRPLPRATTAALLEAARWAPSSGNGQPWAFLVFDGADAAARAGAEACLETSNAWAKRAPLLILNVAREIRPNGKPAPTAGHDLGLATENLLLQGTALGLIVHPMAGFDHHEARRRFAIPVGATPVAMIAIGYPGDPTLLDEKNRAREQEPRTRKPLSEIAFAGRWDRPWP